MQLLCWQPVLTEHQQHTLDALGVALGVAPTYIVAAASLAERERQGWTAAAAAVTVLPERGLRSWVARRIADRGAAIHIFGSPFGDRRLIAVLRQVLAAGERVWLVSEPWADTAESYFANKPRPVDRIKVALRPWLYRVYGRMIRRVAGVFAISPLAVRQYAEIGLSPARVLPFGYFVPGPTTMAERANTSVLRVAFVGALIARKGIGDLADAAALLAKRGSAIVIDVFGPGELPAGSVGLTHRGMIPFGTAATVIGTYDVLVVPSRHDGWAVVVNEAIMAGAAVAASDRTGAGAMVDRWRCGVRFPAGNARALADTLTQLAEDPAALAAMRLAARALAPELTPTRAAEYMAAAIRGTPRPNPWY